MNDDRTQDPNTCATCQFSRISISEITHTRLCQRFPPNTVGSLVPIPNMLTGKVEPQWRTATAHVQVQDDAWCGEWKGQIDAVVLS
jgi:hypothetical protein